MHRSRDSATLIPVPGPEIGFAVNESHPHGHPRSGAHTFYIILLVLIGAGIDGSTEYHFETIGKLDSIGGSVILGTNDVIDVDGLDLVLLDESDLTKKIRIGAVLIPQSVLYGSEQGLLLKVSVVVFVPNRAAPCRAKLCCDFVVGGHRPHAGKMHVLATITVGEILYQPYAIAQILVINVSDLIKRHSVVAAGLTIQRVLSWQWIKLSGDLPPTNAGIHCAIDEDYGATFEIGDTVDAFGVCGLEVRHIHIVDV